MPTWKRLAARKEALANSLAQARRHELEMIHQELEHIDEWLDQQRRQLDALLLGGQPVFVQPETETKAQTEAELQQSRERPVHDEAASAAVEQVIEATLDQIRAQIRHLTHHKARSTVRPPGRLVCSVWGQVWVGLLSL
jgi:anion-transporting  ArsA/GET3 family ATPase